MSSVRPPASWLLLLLLLLANVCAAAAQTADMTAFYDSVTRMSDVGALRTMLSTRSSRNTDSSPATLTERGFIALRLFDLTSQKNQSRLAEESFKKALKRQPSYGWAHYGLGLMYVNDAEAGPGTFVLDEVLDGLRGNDVRTRAHREFKDAITGQPSVPLAAEQLAENAVARNKRKTLDDARSVLYSRINTQPLDGQAWFALGRVEAELGNLDTARIALDKAAANGVNTAESNHARAAILLRVPGHEAEGAKAWFDGLTNLTPEIAGLYFSDIEALLSKDERDSWKQLTTAQQADLLKTFWDMRAAVAGVTVQKRMTEHYKRLAYVREQFYRQNPYGAPDRNALRMLPYSQRSSYDDRGLIYIRHGAPRERVGNIAGRTFESWAYSSLNGGNRVFHFERDSDGEDFHLMHKITCDPEWLSDRARLDARLGRLLAHCSGTDMLAISADIRQDAFEALATDSDNPNFTKDLPFFFDFFTFRAPEGRTSVVAAVAVPREKLNMTEVAANPAYRIDLSLILVDTLTRRVIREDDSLMLALEHNRNHDDLFRLHVEIAVPPSRTTVQRLIISDPTEPGIGQLYGGPFLIPDYTGSKLMLSDIVLAEPGVKGKWHRGDVSLALVPTRYFKGGSFNVFYEVYNMTPNANYSTEVEIEPVRKSTGQKLKGLFGGSSTIRFKFDGEATNVKNGTLQELRRVDAPLASGEYRLRITVKDLQTGESVKNERTFIIPR